MKTRAELSAIFFPKANGFRKAAADRIANFAQRVENGLGWALDPAAFRAAVVAHLRTMSAEIANAPVGADPDGLLADFAAELHMHTPRTQPKIDDSDVASRIKMARTREREYAGRRIREILKSYEEG